MIVKYLGGFPYVGCDLTIGKKYKVFESNFSGFLKFFDDYDDVVLWEDEYFEYFEVIK